MLIPFQLFTGEEGGQRDAVIGSLLQLYQNLQNKATEYQILGHMLIQWCKNIAEVSCTKMLLIDRSFIDS